MSIAAAPVTNESPTPRERWDARWLDRLDSWAVGMGDRLNPILIKETRQALKSRQFVVTFSVLLFAALGWTVVGSLSMMPQIYTQPSAPRMLVGYYVVLAVPMMFVVPLAAYRSLENEIDDGTLELLSITTLSPWQIVLGKLASAMLQMTLYFITLFPCVAYAYNLRGVDLPTTLLIVGGLSVAATTLTVAALFFAPLARTRTGRIMTLLAVVAMLLAAQWIVGAAAVMTILQGLPFEAGSAVSVAVAAVLVAAAVCHFLLTTTAAALKPPSDNRSTSIRVSLLLLTAVVVGVAAATVVTPVQSSVQRGYFDGIVMMVMGLVLLWIGGGSMMAAESSTVTPRVRRELPGTFVGRLTLTYITPGPTTGLVFAAVGLAVLVGLGWLWVERVDEIIPGRFYVRQFRELWAMMFAVSAYAIAVLIAVYWVVKIVRLRNEPRVEIGLAGMAAVLVLSALVPYSIGMHLNDYRAYPHNVWQTTNWAFTLSTIAIGSPEGVVDGVLSMLRDLAIFRWGRVTNNFGAASSAVQSLFLVTLMTPLVLLATIATDPRLAFPRRIATPRRVLLERDRQRIKRQSAAAAGDSIDDGATPVGERDDEPL